MFNCRNGATLKLGGAKTELPWRDTEISKSAGPLRSNLSITWATEVLLRWLKLLWKAKTQGYKFDVGHFGKFPKDAWWQSQPRPGRGGHHGRGWPSVHEISKSESTTARPWWPPRPWLVACCFTNAKLRPCRQPIPLLLTWKELGLREEGVWCIKGMPLGLSGELGLRGTSQEQPQVFCRVFLLISSSLCILFSECCSSFLWIVFW